MTIFTKLALVACALTISLDAKTFDVRDSGAKGNGVDDDQVAIVAAAKLAAAAGGTVYFGPGVYPHSALIDFGSNTQVKGAGPGSILIGTTPASYALRFSSATGSSVTDLHFESAASVRLTNPESATILFDHCTSCSMRRVTVDGGPSVGIMVRTSTDGTVDGNVIENTMADGIHVVDGSARIAVTNNFAWTTGDDSFAAVSYKGSFPQTDSVRIEGNVSIGSHARGVSCIGASHCTIRNNRIEHPGAHGIAVAMETAYNTFRPSAAVLTRNTVRHAQTPGMNGLLVDSADGVAVDTLDVEDSNPIYVTGSTSVSLERVTVLRSNGVGIAGVNTTNLSIDDSVVAGALAGGIRVVGITG
jgi:polygalacturonase